MTHDEAVELLIQAIAESRGPRGLRAEPSDPEAEVLGLVEARATAPERLSTELDPIQAAPGAPWPVIPPQMPTSADFVGDEEELTDLA